MPVYKNARRAGSWRIVVWSNACRHETTIIGTEDEAKRREAEMRRSFQKPTPSRACMAKKAPLSKWRERPWREAIAAALEAHGEAPESGERKRVRSTFVARDGQTSWLYALRANGADGPVKFGRAYKVPWRLQQIRTCCPYHVEVLGVCAAGEAEGVIHDGLRRFHLRGEWYHPTPTVLAVAAHVRAVGDADDAMVACGLAPPRRSTG